MFSVSVYTHTTIPVCLLACVFSVFLCHGRCVFSVRVYTNTTIPVCLIACVFSVFLYHGLSVFSVCVYTYTTTPVCLLACVFSVFLYHGRCVFRGLCQVKKNQKNPRKIRINQTPPTHPLSNFNFFWNIWKHENNTKITKKHNISKKKIIIRVRA